MEYVTKGWEPAALLAYFEEISAIPRCSGNEQAISDYLLSFAQTHGLEATRDEVFNVIIKKPGTADCAPVMLQGHTDMVCEKNAAVVHDFARDPLALSIQDGRLTAAGTTLGADNGAAVAMMLAVLADDTLVHPPLECVFTVQEEVGLIGAKYLDCSQLRARTMINLDSEEEGVATTSCAGGQIIELTRSGQWQPYSERFFIDPATDISYCSGLRLAIGGLKGGHSGSDIHLERGNAILLTGRLLNAVAQITAPQLISITGGSKDNAIPRECTAVIAIDDLEKLPAIDACLKEELHSIIQEYAPTEPGIWVRVDHLPAESGLKQLDTHATGALIDLLTLAPNGVYARNMAVGGFVTASSNLGVIRTTPAQGVTATFSLRSSVPALMRQLSGKLTRLAARLELAQAAYGAYPGWTYAPESPLRDTLKTVYHALLGDNLRCEAIHAGLECGIFCDKLPGLDAIAIGPALSDCHTPDEALDLASCQRSYQFLTAALETLTKA